MKLAADPKYLDIEHAIDFYRQRNPGLAIYWLLNSTDDHRDPDNQVYRTQEANYRHSRPFLRSGYLKNEHKEVIVHDPDFLYFRVGFNHFGSKDPLNDVELPSTLFFDDEGTVKEPVSFYWQDKLYTASFKASLEAWINKLNLDKDCFKPKTIRSIRYFLPRHMSMFLDHAENSHFFSLISDQAVMFNEECELIPFKEFEVLRHGKMQLAKPHIVETEGAHIFTFLTLTLNRDSIAEKKLNVVLDVLKKTLYFHASPKQVDYKRKFRMPDGQDFDDKLREQGFVYKFENPMDFLKTMLVVEKGQTILTIPKQLV